MNIKKIGLFAGIVCISLAFVFTAQAAEFYGPVSENGNVTVGSSELHDNLYTGGGMVNINGNTTGDLVVAGGNVSIEGDVEKDALLAGGTVIINGDIDEDLRMVGGNVTISGSVGGDVMLFGGNVNINDRSVIGGDVVIGAGNVTLNAPVRGDLRIYGGNVEINSTVDGNVWVQAGQALVFGSNARVAGKIIYKGPKEAWVKDGAEVSAIEFTKVEHKSGNRFKGIATAAFLVKLIAWILAGLVLVKFLRPTVVGTLESIKQKPWANLGMGLATLIVVPIVAVILLITIVGYYLSIALVVGYALTLIVTCVLAAVVAGFFILSYLGKPGDEHPDWQAVIIGVVVWSLLSLIPVVGWLLMAAAFLMALGCVFGMVKAKLVDKV